VAISCERSLLGRVAQSASGPRSGRRARRMWWWAGRATATTASRGCWTTGTSRPRWACWRPTAACGPPRTSRRGRAPGPAAEAGPRAAVAHCVPSTACSRAPCGSSHTASTPGSQVPHHQQGSSLRSSLAACCLGRAAARRPPRIGPASAPGRALARCHACCAGAPQHVLAARGGRGARRRRSGARGGCADAGLGIGFGRLTQGRARAGGAAVPGAPARRGALRGGGRALPPPTQGAPARGALAPIAPRARPPGQGPGRGGRRSEVAMGAPAQGDATAWERWVYLFAQLRQLPALAPHLPTARPRLRQARPRAGPARPPDPLPTLRPRMHSLPNPNPNLCPAQTAYELVLHAFLLAPADHERLLALLRAWPPALYSIPALTEAVVQRRARHAPSCLLFFLFCCFSFLFPFFLGACHDRLGGLGGAAAAVAGRSPGRGGRDPQAGRAGAQDPRPGRRQRRAAAGGRAPVPAGWPLRPGAGHPAAPAARRRVRLHHAARPAAAAAPRAHRRARAHRRGAPAPRSSPLGCRPPACHGTTQ